MQANEQLSREDRIKSAMIENSNKSSLERSIGYCTALVDGQIAIEQMMRKKYAAQEIR